MRRKIRNKKTATGLIFSLIHRLSKSLSFINFFFLFLLIGCILYSYRMLPNIYFLHDEWKQYGDYLLYGINSDTRNFTFLEILLGKGRILGSRMSILFFHFFSFNQNPFVVIFLFMHIINSFVIFLFVKKITSNILWAAVSSLLFASSSRYEQVLTWMGAGNQILFSSFFSLVAIYSAFSSKNNIYRVGLSLLFAYIAFLFKEASAFTFVLVAFISGYFNRKNVLPWIYVHKKITTIFSLFIISISLYIVKLYSINIANVDAIEPKLVFPKFVFNSFFYPLVSLSQYIIPFRFVKRIATFMLNFNYGLLSNNNNIDVIINFILSDTVSIFFSGIFLLTAYVILKRNSNHYLFLFICFLWYWVTFLPISLRLINRYDSYIYSIYMYYGGIPFWMLVGGLVVGIKKIILKLINNKLTMFGGICLFTIFLYKQMNITHREVRHAAIRGIDMKIFISEMNKNIEKLPAKPVILLDSDRNYFIDKTRIPFFLGDGFILSVLLYPTGKIPDEILANRIFEGFGETGYIEQADKGFGYYNDKATLLSNMKSGKFDKSQIVYWFYKGDEHILEDRTDEL